MNYKFLCDTFRKNREYTGICEALNRPVIGQRKPYYVSGLSDGAEPLFLKSLCEDFGNAYSPVILIFADEKKAVHYRDFFLSAGISADYFPAREYCFNNVTSSHEYENARLKVLASLAGLSEGASVICTTAEAVLQVTMPAQKLSDLCIRISYDDIVDLDRVTESLTAAGYQRVELVESVGQFAVRGGIMDLYPAGDTPVRVELFGDEIDRIGYFSVETQRFIDGAPDELVIPPVREHIITDEIRDMLIDVIRRHIRRLGKTEGADEKHARAAAVLQGELSSLEHGLEINFADKYLPFLYPEGTCLLDYINGPVVLIDSAASEERFNASNTLTEQSIAGMSEAFELPPVKSGIYLRTYEEIGERQSGPTIFIDALTRSHTGFTPAEIFAFNTRHLPAYSGNMELLAEDIARFNSENYTAVVVCGSDIEKENILDKLTDDGYTAFSADGEKTPVIPENTKKKMPVLLMTGEFSGGFELAYPKLVVMDFSNDSAKPARLRYSIKKQKRKKSASEAILSYADLEVGDIVVHEAYGIGQYMGLENLTIDGSSRDYVHIKYAGSDKLFLPVDQLDHVSKYIGAGSDTGMVKLSKMSGADWTKAKTKAKASAREMAKELIELYAKRKRTKGFAFEPDDDMCREFADSFEYEETDGQLEAINDVRRDMEQPYPMDRLLCGDVGYGKTEVALRAAFKAVMNGKQVAVLVPTTILAYQHYQTFLSRMRAFPVNIDMVSRFRSSSEQQASIRKVKRGDTDIIIGTHRLISKDVEFRDLGLIIIDEEQRFGVAQKEKLKKLQVGADILTLTATPIPRTLNMAMGGIVDMSVLEEAPGLRTPVQTYVMEFDEAIIHEAIRRELRRGGQVFDLYNRVEGIFNVADRIAEAIPDTRIAVAHGKMEREAIEDVWDSL
ncbi:MAG: DEAD/DEAH box helicase, partial [Clostridia bacterium]|nr:DEAD/DEAH box helicase [Clostridia bacterium]